MFMGVFSLCFRPFRSALTHELAMLLEKARLQRQNVPCMWPLLPLWSHWSWLAFRMLGDKDSVHGRWLVQEDADQVLEIAKDALKAHSRPWSLVIFNETWNGKKATFDLQYRIFNSAAVAFGPHGTGFSNVIWVPCTGRPAAVEFICSEQSMHSRGQPQPNPLCNLLGHAWRIDVGTILSCVRLCCR